MVKMEHSDIFLIVRQANDSRTYPIEFQFTRVKFLIELTSELDLNALNHGKMTI